MVKLFGTATAAKEGRQTAIRGETVSTFFVCRPGTYSSGSCFSVPLASRCFCIGATDPFGWD